MKRRNKRKFVRPKTELGLPDLEQAKAVVSGILFRRVQSAKDRLNHLKLWSPNWQQTIRGFIRESDEAPRHARRAKNPENQLALASSAVGRLRNALEYVEEVDKINGRALHVATRVERLRPIDGSYLSQDSLNFRQTLAAGQQAFAVGGYVAARRHLDAALQQAKRVMTAERTERLKRKAEARDWIKILGDKEITAEITNALSHSSAPEFHAEWEQLHKRIDDLVLAKACEMGNRDQKAISTRIGVKRTVKWREHIQWNDLLKFAQAMVKEL